MSIDPGLHSSSDVVSSRVPFVVARRNSAVSKLKSIIAVALLAHAETGVFLKSNGQFLVKR